MAAPTLSPTPSEAEIVAALMSLVRVLEALVAIRAGAAMVAPGATAPSLPAAGGSLPTTGSLLPVAQPRPAPATLAGAPGAGVPASADAPRAPGAPTRARVATFNVLGTSHTQGGGNKVGRYADDSKRMPDMVRQLTGNDIEIAGLQEFQEPQQRAFRAAAPGYEMHGERDNVIVWRADRYRKVADTSLTIPYHGGAPRKMPAVQLEDRATGRRVWVLNVHNPASTKSSPGNAGNRRESERRERELIAKLEATGVPVIVTGDFNDDEQSRSAMTRGGLTHVADPAGSARNIDWVFGTSGVQFGRTTRDTAPRDNGTSDHPIVYTTATF